MKDSGIKVTVPAEFGPAATTKLQEILKISPICTDSSVPGKLQIYFSMEGDLDEYVAKATNALPPVVRSNFSVGRY